MELVEPRRFASVKEEKEWLRGGNVASWFCALALWAIDKNDGQIVLRVIEYIDLMNKDHRTRQPLVSRKFCGGKSEKSILEESISDTLIKEMGHELFCPGTGVELIVPELDLVHWCDKPDQLDRTKIHRQMFFTAREGEPAIKGYSETRGSMHFRQGPLHDVETDESGKVVHDELLLQPIQVPAYYLAQILPPQYFLALDAMIRLERQRSVEFNDAVSGLLGDAMNNRFDFEESRPHR